MTERDNRRQRLYDAERAVTLPESATARRLLHEGKRVASTGNISIEACQSYVDYVTMTAWFQRRWGRRRLTVRHKVHGNATADLGGTTICLPPWAREEWTILHEVAHCLTPSSAAAHGPEFVAAYLTLVRQQMGKAAYDLLRESLRTHRFGRIASLIKPNPNLAVVPRAELEAKVARAARERARTQRAEREAQRARTHRRLVGYEARHNARSTLRALIKDGHFGPAGSASRQAALATARALLNT